MKYVLDSVWNASPSAVAEFGNEMAKAMFIGISLGLIVSVLVIAYTFWKLK